MKLSIVVLVRNEEKNIVDCLEGLSKVSEVVIIDDYSTDRSFELIKSLKLKNTKVFKNRLNGDFSKQRNFGLKKARNSWVSFLDSDERASQELLKEIEEIIENTDNVGFFLKRTDVIWGKKLNHGEMGDTKLLRLARKNVGRWEGKVHETWRVDGEVGQLKNELIHYPHQSIKEFLSEVNFYSTLRAEELAKAGVKSNFFYVVFYPKAKFLLNYIFRMGFRDGIPGLIVALMMSFHSFLTRAKLWQLGND